LAPPNTKEGHGAAGQIAAQTFTFRELATATKNFRPDSFVGEGGFGRVYKGRLETTGQVQSLLSNGEETVNHHQSLLSWNQWFLSLS